MRFSWKQKRNIENLQCFAHFDYTKKNSIKYNGKMQHHHIEILSPKTIFISTETTKSNQFAITFLTNRRGNKVAWWLICLNAFW